MLFIDPNVEEDTYSSDRSSQAVTSEIVVLHPWIYRRRIRSGVGKYVRSRKTDLLGELLESHPSYREKITSSIAIPSVFGSTSQNTPSVIDGSYGFETLKTLKSYRQCRREAVPIISSLMPSFDLIAVVACPVHYCKRH